ncbi:MAG TPA: double-strand break repair protein AddB [Stellaceae bacterium]
MRPAVFTIASDLPFLDTLVAGLMAESGGDPLALARHTILLPTRRAVRALREAFLRASGGRALLLPRLAPVGDVDAEELVFLAEEAESEPGFDIPPAVPELRRQLLLTRLVLAWGRARGSGPVTAGQAAPLARELARFLDEVQTEGCDLARLAELVPANYAQHWQQSLEFLGILTEHWPRLLAENGCLDPAERRNRALAAQAEAWRRDPPSHPVIAAGLSGGVAAVADLLAVVACLPQGAVVLPEVDRDIDAESWGEIAGDPAHPQHLPARLLRRLEIEPADLRPWPAPGLRGGRTARRRLVAEALRPAAESHRWRGLAGIDGSALDGLMRLDCPGSQEEAAVIALLLRQRLEHPGETAALVTPDRGLARRVAAELGRWGIEIDDSAGVPLGKTPPGVFLRMVLDVATERLAPLPLLAALKHPLAACGSAPEAFRAQVRRLEIAVLRGPRPAPGIAGLRAALPEEKRGLDAFIDRLEMALAPLLAALAQGETPVRALVAAHVAAAEALAASAAEDGAARLWREAAGEAAAEFVAELLQAADSLPPLDGAGYQALFEALIAGPVVRPRFGRHPRLAIWGLLEARLQHADLLILGGLNEGVWPPQAESDPWLSRPMRREFGLPPPERRIGVAAHDFAQALGAREVVLTRALRVEGAPTVPSRWLLRLETVLRAAGLEGRLGAAVEPLAWQALLDEPPARLALAPPEPRPPVAARPRQLAVTQVETWMRDPYALYAREILRLKALEPIDADPGAADRGIFIHQALDDFVRAFPDALPADAEAQLLAMGVSAFGNALERPGVRAFWWPRFERIARWFVAEERQRRQFLAATCSELKGQLGLAGPAGRFVFTAKADRIDRRREGGLVLIDYKTGAVPSPKDVELGFSPQLPLEAAMAEGGGFAGIAPASISEIAYWHLTGGDPPGEVKPLAADAAAAQRLVADAVAGVSALIARFDDPGTPYRAVPWPEKAPRYSDYVHLARVKEWSIIGEAGE